MIPQSFLVVIPAYNEGRVLSQMAEETVLFLRSHVRQFELILVDDGSRDNTPLVIRTLEERFPEVSSILHRTNLGYGASLQDGFFRCRFEWVFFTDADRKFQIWERPA